MGGPSPKRLEFLIFLDPWSLVVEAPCGAKPQAQSGLGSSKKPQTLSKNSGSGCVCSHGGTAGQEELMSHLS